MSVEGFRQSLLAAGLLIDGGSPGVYHRSFSFESIVSGLEVYISSVAADEERRQFQFSPLIASSALVRSDYLALHPDLIGMISSYAGREADLPSLLAKVAAGEEWSELLSPTDLALCGAACHNLYPLLADAALAADSLLYEVQAVCFRHEPSNDPSRMQSFRMREFVYVGSESGALAHREQWLHRGTELMRRLGLSVDVVVANDPFFGRGGLLIGAGQREKERKFEMVTSITSESPGAIGSANYHEDHFGRVYNISQSDASVAHTACVGFGLERITLALLHQHGLDVDLWPAVVRDRVFSAR